MSKRNNENEDCGIAGAAMLCALAWMPSAWGAISVVQKSAEYKIIVDAATVNDSSSLLLVWDTEDCGETLSGWAGSRVVTAGLTSAGGEFYTPIPCALRTVLRRAPIV